MKSLILFAFSFLLSFIVAYICGVKNARENTTVGTLKIDVSDPEKDIFLIEIDNFEKLYRSSHITLKVDRKLDI